MLSEQDLAAARARLEEYERLCIEWSYTAAHSAEEERVERLLLMRRAVVDVLLERVGLLPDRSGDWQGQYQMACVQAMGLLEDEALIARIQDNTGPQLGAPQLHLWVWGAASGLWDSGHYREAVAAAGASVSAQVQSKVGRFDIADADLMNQVLSPREAKDGEPRLRVRGDHTNRFTAALQEGLVKLAAGAFAVVRNPATHDVRQWDEREALEQLACLSLLARRLDDAVALRYSGAGADGQGGQ